MDLELQAITAFQYFCNKQVRSIQKPHPTMSLSAF